MAKRSPRAPEEPSTVTAARAARLHRLVLLLSKQPQTRDMLRQQLGVDVRDFYRDLNLLREWGIEVPMRERHYELSMPLESAYARLPFPDPHLSVAEALQLAAGRTAAHRKLKSIVHQVLQGKPKGAKRKVATK
jgi:biotin operon repressor